MSSGVLQFTLGLSAGGFMGPLGLANRKVLGFIGTVASLGAITHGVMSAIEKGAELRHLSAQLQESSGEIYQLQEGFKAIGLDSEKASYMINYMRYAMSGVGQMGNRANLIFSRMGLNLDQLRKLDTVKQITAITGALSKMNKESATGAASALFGVTNAANFMQAAGMQKDLVAAMADAADEAAVFGRNAAAFETFDTTLGRIKGRVSGLFAGVAEGLVPALQRAADASKKINFVGIGQDIGHIIRVLYEAFSDGTLSKLIGLTIETGFKIGLQGVYPLMEELGHVLLVSLEKPLIYLQSRMEHFIQELMAGPFLNDKLNKALGFQGSDFVDPFSKIYARNLKNGLELGFGDYKYNVNDFDFGSEWKRAKDQMTQTAKPLLSMIDGLLSRAKKLDTAQSRGLSGSQQQQTADQTSLVKPEYTSLEKMGFVMNGLSNPATQHLSRIEGYMAESVRIQRQTLSQIGQSSGLVNEV